MKPENFLREALDEAQRRAHLLRGASGVYVLQQLVARGGLRVQQAPGVGTARLRQLGGRALIEVDPEFVQKEIREPADALHLLGHEILHHVRGDLSRFLSLDRATWMLLNIALDMFVDANLERLWFLGEGAPYQRRLFSHEQFPAVLLLPPKPLFRRIGNRSVLPFLNAESYPMGYSPEFKDSETWDAMHGCLQRWFQQLGTRNPQRLADLYLLAWFNAIGFKEFWQQFRAVMQDELSSLSPGPVLLLGNHDHPKGRNSLTDLLDDLIIRALGPRAGVGGSLTESDLCPWQGPVDPGPILAALERALDTDTSNPIVRRRLAPDRGVLGRVGRREALFLALGYPPLFWSTEHVQDIEIDEQVQIYLDASASMDAVLPFLFRLIAQLEDRIGDRIHVFSESEPVSVSIEEVKMGKYSTCFGTDFNSLVEHALAKSYKRILVLTDGYAHLDSQLAQRARDEGLEVYLVLTGEPICEDNDLRDLARETWEWKPPSSDGSPWNEVPFRLSSRRRRRRVSRSRTA